jgi:hypothetical protein
VGVVGAAGALTAEGGIMTWVEALVGAPTMLVPLGSVVVLLEAVGIAAGPPLLLELTAGLGAAGVELGVLTVPVGLAAGAAAAAAAAAATAAAAAAGLPPEPPGVLWPEGSLPVLLLPVVLVLPPVLVLPGCVVGAGGAGGAPVLRNACALTPVPMTPALTAWSREGDSPR